MAAPERINWLQLMDLNEYTKVQCFNCHNDIFRTIQQIQQPQGDNAVCQECINRECNQITAMKGQTSILHRQLEALEGLFSQELVSYGCQEEDEGQFNGLEQKLQHLKAIASNYRTQEDQLDRELHELIVEYEKLQEAKDNQTNMLHQRIKGAWKQCQTERDLGAAVFDLELRKQKLKRLSILNQLYDIHFDDKVAYINQQPVSHTSSKIILEIICLLVDKYHYKDFTVNFCEDHISNSEGKIKITTRDQSSALPWLNFLATQIAPLWEHIKHQAALITGQKYQSFGLPLKIQTEPKLSIYGVPLKEGPEFTQFLKYLTHNLKFMMNFDQNVEMMAGAGSKREE